MTHTPLLFFILIVLRLGNFRIFAQAGLTLPGPSDPPATAYCVVNATGAHHHAHSDDTFNDKRLN